MTKVLLILSLVITFSLQAQEKNVSGTILDVKEQDLVQLNIDLVQRGVAGNDSWGSGPEEKYLIKGDMVHTYSYFLIPFEKGEKEFFIKTNKQFIEK